MDKNKNVTKLKCHLKREAIYILKMWVLFYSFTYYAGSKDCATTSSAMTLTYSIHHGKWKNLLVELTCVFTE